MLHEYFTHEGYGSVQLLAILPGEVLVELVHFPLALVINLRTDNHSPTRMDVKHNAKVRFNASSILKRVNLVDVT